MFIHFHPFPAKIARLIFAGSTRTIMMKSIYTGLLFLSLSAAAQDGLQAETENGKPYLLHTVSPGETLSSLSRNYKLSVAEIAAFNKISTDKGLQKDQKIRIPLQSANFTQGNCSSCAKVYYKVQPGEGLYRIGLNFGNVKTDILQKLNNLPAESVDIGQNLLVGYLSAPAGKVTATTTQQTTTPVNNTTTGTGTKVPEVAGQVKTPAPDTRPKETVQQNTPVQQAPPPVVTPQQQQTTTNNNTQLSSNTTQGSGLFAAAYEGKMNVTKGGTAGVFKSTSGWGDEKYYVLMNNAAPGTIVKVDNPATGKSVYAKVLGELPPIKQNENVLLRISNAAAAALGGNEESLTVTVFY